MSFNATVTVSDTQIASLIYTATQNASWPAIIATRGPVAWRIDTDHSMSYPDDWQEIPLAEDGVLVIVDQDVSDQVTNQPRFLNRASIQKGLTLIAREHPTLMADILTGNTHLRDAEHFLDCCLYGKIVH